jgi:hypothetical protein
MNTNTINNLSGDATSADWVETRGILATAIREHADQSGWFVLIDLGQAGLRFRHGNTVIGIETEDLYELAKAKATALMPQLNVPTATPNTGNTPLNVTLAHTVANVNIYYTTNNATPDGNSNLYSNALTLANATTLKAIAMKDDWRASNVVTLNFA